MKSKTLSILKYVLIFVIAFTVFGVLQFSLDLFLCPDSYYHLKMAEMMLDGKFIHQQFPWLQFSVLKDHFVDHHFLFHLLLMPFVKFNPIIGAKIASILFASLAVLAFYILLAKNKISLAFWWTIILLFSSSSFLFRMILIRVPALSLFFLLMLLFCFYYDFKSKWLKYCLIAMLSFGYVWLYGGFFFLIIFAIIYYLCQLIFAHKFDWKGLLVCFGALALSIVLNPYIRNFYSFLKIQIFGTGPFTKIPVGAEWSPFGDWDFLTNNLLTILAFVAGIIVLIIDIILKKYKIRKELFAFKISLFLIACMFFAMTLRSQRFVEYMVPFCLLFGAFCLSDYLVKINLKQWYKELIEALKIQEHFYATKTWLKIYWKLWLKFLIFTLIIIFIIAIGLDNFLSAKASVTNSSAKNVPDLKKAALWSAANTPKNSIILNLDWSDFPPLFLYNSQNYYSFGLDPTFTYNFNLDLYNKWQDIAREKNDAYSVIKNDFGANYVLVNNKNKTSFTMFEDDVRFERVFDSKYCRIYKLNE